MRCLPGVSYDVKEGCRSRASASRTSLSASRRFCRGSLVGDSAQLADQPIRFRRQRFPRGFVRVELAGAADLLERARGAHDGIRLEIGGGALESVGGAAQRFAVARV